MFGSSERERTKNAANFTTSTSKAYRPSGRSGAESKDEWPSARRPSRSAMAILRETSSTETLDDWKFRQHRGKASSPGGETTFRLTTESGVL